MTINPNHVSALVTVDPRPMLWRNWVALRNGDLSLIEEITALTLALHLPTADGTADRQGRPALVSWLSEQHRDHPDARLTVEVGPIIGADLIVGRWTRSGVRAAGTDQSHRGRSGAISGVDVIRIDGERIVEFWGLDDAWPLDRRLDSGGDPPTAAFAGELAGGPAYRLGDRLPVRGRRLGCVAA